MLTWGSVGVPLLKVRCSEGVESYLDDTSSVCVVISKWLKNLCTLTYATEGGFIFNCFFPHYLQMNQRCGNHPHMDLLLVICDSGAKFGSVS